MSFRLSRQMLLVVSLFFIFIADVYSASHSLGLSDGLTTFETPAFSFTIVNDSQTAYSIRPSGPSGSFDFLPYDVMSKRDSDGQYHLGDVTFRVRIVGSPGREWIDGDSAQNRLKVTALPTSGNTLAAADLSPTFPPGSPINITRRWVLEDSHLRLLFDVSNTQASSVELGSLGAPLEFNNIFTGRSTDDTNNNCSFFDPYIGLDAGYVQVTPLLGTLAPLLVTPVGKSPLEGWRFLQEETSSDPFYQSQTFEGLYEWQFHTLAYAENEWGAVVPWNNATSAIIRPGEMHTYGIQFDLAPSVREIDDTLVSLGRPVAVGVPGYVLPQDQIGKLFLNYVSPVRSLAVSPDNALSLKRNSDSLNSSWVGFDVTPNVWGRSRLTFTFDDGTTQSIHYYITKEAAQVMSDLGHFLTTNQWFDDSSDPFRRSPSVISYDREVDGIILNDPRAWIPGLSDEAGAGPWLAAAMKQYVQPTIMEVAKMETFVNSTLWGSIQNTNGSGGYSVKKSVFFYQPDLVPEYNYPSSINWGNWWSWNQDAAYATDRAYDYVHVCAAYWALYRVARNYETIPISQTWKWFINQAFETVMKMTDGTVGFANDGLMDETVFLYLLDDLKREGLTANATAMETRMRARQTRWSRTRFPFASEMAWDSTAQEGVYAWSKYFNDTTTATNALNSILAYQPTIAHWGYNGNARRYWDNIYGGKLMRYERQIHHYGSGLNSLPVISQFESDPDDFYLLRVGFGGLSGPLTNIDQDGFASASFHSFPDTLKWDAYSGDYGPNFVGHALNSGTYLVRHPTFGWQAFGGIVTSRSETNVHVQVRDSVRRRVFIASLGVLFTLDAGAFDEFTFNPESRAVTLTILPSPRGIEDAAAAPRARLIVARTTDGAPVLRPTADLRQDAGAWIAQFESNVARVTFVPSVVSATSG